MQIVQIVNVPTGTCIRNMNHALKKLTCIQNMNHVIKKFTTCFQNFWILLPFCGLQRLRPGFSQWAIFFYQKSYLLHESWQQLVTPMFSFCPDFRSPRDPISCHLSSGRKHNLARPMPASAFAGVNTLLLKSKISKTFFPGLPPLPSYHCQLGNIEETRKLLSGCVALVALGDYWLNICKRANSAQSNDL